MKNLKNLFWESSLLFKELKEKPTSLLPFIIACVVTIILTILFQSIQTEIILQNLPDNIPKEDIAFMLERSNNFRFIGYAMVPFRVEQLIVKMLWKFILHY